MSSKFQLLIPDAKEIFSLYDSDTTWMYDSTDTSKWFPKKPLLLGLEQQKAWCVALIDRIEKGLPCDIALSIENLRKSVSAFKRDFARCSRAVDGDPLETCSPENVNAVYKLLHLNRSSALAPKEQKSQLSEINKGIQVLENQCYEISLGLNKKLESLQKSHEDLQGKLQSQKAQTRNLVIAMAFGVAAIACAKFIF